MFRSHRRHASLARQLILLTALPLALAGTGYALFSKSLTLTADTAKPYYSSTQQLYASYTKTETANGSNTNYSLSMRVTNKGVTGVTAWQVKFDVPSGVGTVTCQNTVTCTKSGVTVTLVNKTANRNIAAGAATANFTITFTSATARYTLQNMYTSGTYATTYAAIAGLTVGYVRGTVTNVGATYTYPYTFTVTNNTAQTLGWRAVCTWTNNPTTKTVSPTVTFTAAAAQITFTYITSVPSLTNFVFTGTFTRNSSTWTISGCTVTGLAL